MKLVLCSCPNGPVVYNTPWGSAGPGIQTSPRIYSNHQSRWSSGSGDPPLPLRPTRTSRVHSRPPRGPGFWTLPQGHWERSFPERSASPCSQRAPGGSCPAAVAPGGRSRPAAPPCWVSARPGAPWRDLRRLPRGGARWGQARSRRRGLLPGGKLWERLSAAARRPGSRALRFRALYFSPFEQCGVRGCFCPYT